MRNLRLLFSSLIVGSLSLSAFADSSEKKSPMETDWYPVTTENKPFVRWWWLGSAVDTEGLTFNLSEFAEKGLGGVEITPIYGVKGNEANDIDYLSPSWMQMLTHTVNEGNRLGLQIDMNNGTGWPFGGPNVGTEYGARKLVTETWTVAPGKKFEVKVEHSDSKQQPVAKLQSVIAVSGDTRLRLDSNIDKNGILRWKAAKAKEDWKVYAIFSGRTFQKVKRAAPGGEGYVLNHYDSVAVNHYFDRFDEAFKSSGAPLPDTFFNDSYEVYGSDWADNILEEFSKDHGYDLDLLIDIFTDNNNADERRQRILRDYRYTLGRMLRENFTDIWLKRAHAQGVRVRNQSHGSPANILDLYAAVDIPECESFGQTDFNIPGLIQDGPTRPSDSDPAVLKFASSAAHVAGKPLTSAETLTWLTEHFRTSLARAKPEIDQMFASGVNHVYFHGAPYSPKGTEFPGWMFYASINMSPTNSIWQDADSLFAYIARVQSFLSAGTPDNDFLLYFPIEDVWQRQGGNPYLMFDIHKMQQRMPDIKRAVNEIMRAGYDCDYISDALLDSLTVAKNGMLVSKSGAEYPALIIPPVKYMQPSTLRRILQLCREGATVVFVGELPKDVPGLGYLEERRDEFNRLMKELPSFDGEKAESLKFADGRIIFAKDFDEAIKLTGVRPETLRRDMGVTMIRRKNEVGGHNYFISQLTNNPIDTLVSLATPGAVEIFDPLTGKRGMAQTFQGKDGETLVRLQLKPGQSVLLKTFPEHPQFEQWDYIDSEGQPVKLDRGWQLQFVKSEPPIEGTFDIDSIMSWTELPDENAKVNFGTGRYTVTFNLPADAFKSADDWVLDLGTVRESADVKVNGHAVGKVWSVPFVINVGKYLHPGENTIEIDVTNLQANRIADYERRGVEWRKFKDANIASVTNAKEFSFGDWPVIPAGLTSEVTLIPVKYSPHVEIIKIINNTSKK